MDNNQVTAEWIAQQRQISEIVNMTYEDAPGSVVPLLKQLEKSQTAALDALEASMKREAEMDATIARLTVERDAAIVDLRGSGACFSCKHFRRNGGNCFGAGRCRTEGISIFPCDEPGEYMISIPDDGRDFYEWRSLCAENAPSGAESE